MGLTHLFKEFFSSEKSSGFILIACSVFAITITNTSWGDQYLHIWHTAIGNHTAEYWINDGLMTIFFLLVGLEIERELYIGELSSLKNALLPVAAAAGGMFVPAAIHLSLNAGTATQGGAGIPMATDIAFALGVLSLAGSRVPPALKVFLTALAIIDDLGAILVIAVFYSHGFSWLYFGLAMGIFALLLVFNRLKWNNLLLYLIPGTAMWYCMLNSGVHATISGVLLAFAIPFGDGGEKSPSYILQHLLHKPVAFIIIPLFALANTGIHLQPGFQHSLTSRNSLGIFLGLYLGKPAGILMMCWLALKLKWCSLPEGINRKHLLGAGFLGGIGFTMSIFITLLAYTDAPLVVNSKIAVFLTSVIAGLTGYFILRTAKRTAQTLP
ncbi:MAG: Na+/H+ antiporter NhaA [Chitinophagaceae bacterium]|nr:Na+/H+ antiporter NhaA [Chitinophagaceae bacterium]